MAYQKKELKKDIIITIKRLGINGEGIGYYKKKIIFIPGALPDEVVVAKIIKTHPGYIEGELVRIKEKSPNRVAFPNKVDPEIGGLELAHLSYDKQLEFKKDIVLESLRKYHPRGYQKYKVKNTIPAKENWHYRAKAQYQLEFSKGKTKLGMYAPNSRRLIDLPEMPTQSKNTQKTERLIKKLIDKYHMPVANWRKHFDGIKTVVVREAASTGEMQVTFITIGKKINGLKKLAQEVMKLDNVVSVFQNETDWNNPQIWGNKTIKLAGKNQIVEHILDKKFALSPRAFFQLNPEQTEILYSEAIKLLNLAPDQVLIDAYSGVGTIGLIASDYVKQVIGIESIPEAVEDAMHNVKLNHVRNAEYLQGSVEKILPQLKNSGVPIDALIVDPPRTGLAKSLIKTIMQVKPESFVYISCNPSTLAQDLVMLSEVYDVRVIENVDMLPQTARCEAIAKLVLRKDN
ncbi:23S rRNA (uracil(1939)-C(5))-methyltransferase RlmD [Lactobacillus jensenii]|jgi:23S rRNA (uracil-5-)-methyltransferase rumA|uniref:23S rRNA (Uracil(1939)-C(5))-methyltransferase RlmD n=1 Tax=Lactobacillus jensenii TaxID=109790 RepID=A0A5N1IH61_LACJE|nr:23S rRNA (uracil(1939)-C(5))-methyltransferase RlmD [Lactobacillus jensenii]APT14419.1 23S rRNA (uracil-5-)-methyltransferase RumA [Lactobacillus jensenii]EEQ25027.1 23S rRNA (uracil-5-)-methyltransferase RumA [Lactobacillus jensenii 269-3]EEX28072.1 23S rRNA (uracil-5-)-methyltransferase RumA [Lactobacillus jensenii SJ-7A-US]KAA9236813.1 23S rRNA (uracil(1939)-C(5))-methyltransferase RlmD [Lactobacillus jensenii]KAA9257859.1 23S rRNA (uracil(1939)-C(5))-methyltransferase RlmD [Lactobacillu